MAALEVWHVSIDTDEACPDARDMFALLLITPFYVHLVRDSVRDQLESIIRAGTVTARALANQATHIISRLSLRSIEDKTVAEILHSFGLETRQSTVQHQFNNMAQVIAVLSCREIGLDGKLFKPSVRLADRAAAHDCDHLGGEFEGRTLEFDATGGDVKAESKIDVNDMASIVNHDVAVVSVFELQQEADNTVRGHGLDKVAACGLEADAVFVAVAADEVVIEPVDGFTTQHVARDGVWQHINDAAPRCRGGHTVGEDPDVETNGVEDTTEGSNHLQCEHVLAAVVTDFEDSTEPSLVGVLLLGKTRAWFFFDVLDQAGIGLFLADAEGGHEGSLGMGLQWFARVTVDADDLTIGVTGKVNTNLDFDLAQLLCDLLLLHLLRLVQNGAQSTRYASDFVEEGELTFVELMVFFREAGFQTCHDLVKGRLDRIRL